MSLLTLNNICKNYGTKEVLKDVSLCVERGDRVALIGSNGSGKSTLLKIIIGREQPDSGRCGIGRGVRVGYLSQSLDDLIVHTDEGICTALYNEKAASLEKKLIKLADAMQESGDDEDSKYIMEKYARLLEQYEHMDGYVSEAKIRTILMGLGLRQDTVKLPLDRLSGGEKMRVALARALLDEPDVLIMDEPTNHLDIRAMEWLEKFLTAFDGAVLFVSHDRYFLEQVANCTAELEFAHLKFKRCGFSAYIDSKEQIGSYAQKESKRLKQEIASALELAQRLKNMKKIASANSRIKLAERLKKELDEGIGGIIEDNNLKKKQTLAFNFDKVNFLSSEIVSAEELGKKYGDRVLFSNITFSVRGGERIGIIGPNGCGKSTLLNIMTGKDTDYSGMVSIGSWVKYGVIGQEIKFENEDMTVKDTFVMRHGMTEDEALSYLGRFMFYSLECEKKLSVLSGGERARVYLAELLLDKTDCLILDEPTNHLDISSRNALESALQAYNGTVLTITHDRMLLEACADKIFDMSDGHLKIYDGKYSDYKRECDQEAEREAERRRVEEARAAYAKKQEKKKKASAQPVKINYEKEITVLEEQLREMEKTFEGNRDPELYHKYSELQEKIEELYGLWAEQ